MSKDFSGLPQDRQNTEHCDAKGLSAVVGPEEVLTAPSSLSLLSSTLPSPQSCYSIAHYHLAPSLKTKQGTGKILPDTLTTHGLSTPCPLTVDLVRKSIVYDSRIDLAVSHFTCDLWGSLCPSGLADCQFE